MNKGLIHIYEGDGKGKTTACVGLSVRCAGSGRKVIFSQFMKDNKSSELNILKQIDNITVILCDKTFGFSFNMTPEQKKEAKEVFNEYLRKVTKEAVDTNADMLVMDELIATYNLDFVDHEFFIDFLKNKPEGLEVVMSGREPQKELVDLADYVSCVKKVKHPFEQGIPARVGVEK